MTDEELGAEHVPGSLTRRNALRAGVAVGVGVAAWSGASITSFGGTPAYAAVCSQALPPVNVSGDCRNTTQASGCNPFGYQPETFTPPAGYSLTPIGSNVCCNLETAGTFGFPANTTCTLTFYFASHCGQLGQQIVASQSFGPQFSGVNTPGSMPIKYKCPDTIISPIPSSVEYFVLAFCFKGQTAPDPSCFPTPS